MSHSKGVYCVLCRKQSTVKTISIPTVPLRLQIFKELMLKTTSKEDVDALFSSNRKSTTICESHVPGYKEEIIKRRLQANIPKNLIPVQYPFLPNQIGVHPDDVSSSPQSAMHATSQQNVHASPSSSMAAFYPFRSPPTSRKNNLNEDRDGSHSTIASREDSDSELFSNDKESSYSPSTIMSASIDIESDIAEDNIEDGFEESYYMVKGSELLKLVNRTCTCGGKMEMTAKSVGACPTIALKCPCEHEKKWSGSPNFTDHTSERAKEINIIFPMAVYLSGLSYFRVTEIAATISLKIPTRQYYHRILREQGYDAANAVYDELMKQILEEVREEYAQQIPKLHISTDAQYDSPGFCAMLAKITLMCMRTRYILNVIVLDRNKHGGGNSGCLELQGTIKAIDFIMTVLGWSVETLTTDRATSVQKYMTGNHGPDSENPIVHLFDRWHIMRTLNNTLRQKAKPKKYALIGTWKKATLQHVFYSIKHGGGNAELTKELLRSHLLHIQNIHEWHDDPSFSHIFECNHGPIPSNHKAYMNKNSDAFAALGDILNEKILSDLSRCNAETDTSSVESFHGVVNKFAWKRGYYAYEHHKQRVKLATMEWNEMVQEERKGTRFVARRQKTQHKYNDEPVWKKVKVGGHERKWRKQILEQMKHQRVDMLNSKVNLRNSIYTNDAPITDGCDYYDTDDEPPGGDPLLEEEYDDTDLFTAGRESGVIEREMMQLNELIEMHRLTVEDEDDG